MLPIAAALVTSCTTGNSAELHANYPPDSKRVLVVYNGSSEFGEEIADYYVTKRHIPLSNVVRVTCIDNEEVPDEVYREDIEKPVREALHSIPDEIDFIVLTKGVPIRMADEQHYSVDAWLAAASLNLTPITTPSDLALSLSLNPYYKADEPFSSHKFGFYLVTRLDGYTLADCKALVDRSVSARPSNGPFLLDEAANRTNGDYGAIQQGLVRADRSLRERGLAADLDDSPRFAAPTTPLAGYASWGSNDGAFDPAAYHSLRFQPGAICETFVSTSGRTFLPTKGGQSLIADLITQGVTGIKGYVSEPFTFALAKPDILFDRYTRGRNLAESFYAASEFLKWKDVVIGDPLCAPYRK